MTVPVVSPKVIVTPPSTRINRNSNTSNNTMQVPLWTVDEVSAWAKRAGFAAFSNALVDAAVDGDLLLVMDDRSLKEDIGMTNGILRKRFLRELNSLKRSADYSSCDAGGIAAFLTNYVGADYRSYTYNLIRGDLSLHLLKRLNENDLRDALKEAGIESSIHRLRIIEAVNEWSASMDLEESEAESSSGSSLLHCASEMPSLVDVFVSSPAGSRGSEQLASLIKMHLQLRGLSVYSGHASAIGSASSNGLNYIREAKHFVLVLSRADALDECIGDLSRKSVLHSEIVTALQAGCNVIPVLEDFVFPDPENLPEDIRGLCYLSGVRWAHDYQDACIDKLERFIRGDDVAHSPSKDLYMRLMSSSPLSRCYLSGVPSGDSGRSTPTRHFQSTPVFGRKLRYRTFSTDSAIASSTS